MRKLGPRNIPKVYIIDGKEWDYLKLMDLIKQSKYTAKQRLQRYKAGEIEKWQLFHVGPIPTGGYATGKGNEEYRKLQDKRDRPENLKVQNPTKFDRKFFGTCINNFTQI